MIEVINQVVSNVSPFMTFAQVSVLLTGVLALVIGSR